MASAAPFVSKVALGGKTSKKTADYEIARSDSWGLSLPSSKTKELVKWPLTFSSSS